MVNLQYVYDIIQKLMSNNNGRIAVYGLGEYAEIIIREFGEYIYCVCDGTREEGTFVGHPIISLYSLPSKNVTRILIATGRKSEEIVYRRIHDYCRLHGILIYGVQSGDLSKAGNFISCGISGEKIKDELWDSIEKYEIVSFDVFDTLLMRCTLYPDDVFEIVEYRARNLGIDIPKDFKNYRSQAEFSLEESDKNMFNIYQNLKKMLGLSESETNVLIKLEMQVENEVIFPRREMVEVAKHAKKMGKKILLVSDMYLPQSFLEKVLADHDIDFYDKLYVSNCYGTSKENELFDIVRKDNPATSYLHIGDNSDADGWGAVRKGIDSFLIKSALNMFREVSGSEFVKYLDDLNEHILVGMFLKEAFENPFILNREGERKVTTVYEFAKIFLAPFASSYVVWLLKKVKEQPFDAVLFASRDGYVFKKMYDKAISTWELNVPKSVYLYISRVAGIGMSVRDIADLEWLKIKTQKRFKHFLVSNFGLNIGNDKIDEGDNCEIWEKMLNNQDDIYKESKNKYIRYAEYLKSIDFNVEGKYAFVDMCSQGTTQCALSKIGIKYLYGLYLKRNKAKDIISMGYVESFIPQSYNRMFLNNVLEFVFSSNEPSVIDFGDKGEIIFKEENRDDMEINEMIGAQNGVMEFWSKYLSLANPKKNVPKSIGRLILDLCISKTFTGSLSVFDGYIIHEDLLERDVPCVIEVEKAQKAHEN